MTLKEFRKVAQFFQEFEYEMERNIPNDDAVAVKEREIQYCKRLVNMFGGVRGLPR